MLSLQCLLILFHVVVIYIIVIPSVFYGNASYHDFSYACRTMYIVIMILTN